MAENPKDQSAEIEPLSDGALEDVAGGSSGSCCSCTGCSGTSQDPPQGEIIIA